MDSNKSSITSTISYVKIFALLMILYMVIGGYFSISFASKIRSIPLAVLGFLVFVIGPIAFGKPIGKFFFEADHI